MRLLLVLSAILFLIPCTSRKIILINEEKNIRSLLQQERKAHFEKNVDLFVSEFTDSMVLVNKGKITKLSVEQNKKRIEHYFSSVEFIKWDDIADPIINFFEDGTLAYAIIQKQVILTYPVSMGKKIIDTTDYAGVSIYCKQKGQWKVECNISTNK